MVRTRFGNFTTPFSAGDFAFQASLARSIHPLWRAGASLKWIFSSLEGYSSTRAVLDLGLHRRSLDGLTQLGLVSTIWGPSLHLCARSITNRCLLICNLALAGGWHTCLSAFLPSSYHLHRWNLLYEDPNSDQDVDLFGEPIPGPSAFSKVVDNLFRHVIFSGEILLGKQENLQIRFGYNHLRRKELSVDQFRVWPDFRAASVLK
ncbi:MAG: hypothetical protein H6561_21155 [Lewinellaceae bacterium]|nr:hypothetical protein [Lewinellaceae bacterium]